MNPNSRPHFAFNRRITAIPASAWRGFALLACLLITWIASATVGANSQQLSSLNRFLAIGAQQQLSPAIPRKLSLPIAVGIALVPPSHAIGGIHYEDRVELLEAVQKRINRAKYVRRTEIIPQQSIEHCQQYRCFKHIAKQFNVAAIALVNYDQLPMAAPADRPLSSPSIDYIAATQRAQVSGSSGEIHTFVNTSVFLIDSHQLVLSANGYQATQPKMGTSPNDNASALNFQDAKGEMLAQLTDLLKALPKQRALAQRRALPQQSLPPSTEIASLPIPASSAPGDQPPTQTLTPEPVPRATPRATKAQQAPAALHEQTIALAAQASSPRVGKQDTNDALPPQRTQVAETPVTTQQIDSPQRLEPPAQTREIKPGLALEQENSKLAKTTLAATEYDSPTPTEISQQKGADIDADSSAADHDLAQHADQPAKTTKGGGQLSAVHWLILCALLIPQWRSHRRPPQRPLTYEQT